METHSTIITKTSRIASELMHCISEIHKKKRNVNKPNCLTSRERQWQCKHNRVFMWGYFSFSLRADTIVETKLAFKLVKTTEHCSTALEKFLVVLDFLVTTTSTDTLTPEGTLSSYQLSHKSLVKQSLPCLLLSPVISVGAQVANKARPSPFALG